jgi:predicted MFS family arabinose efflux permease
MAVAMRSLVAGYPVRDHALSMVLFSACESLGQAIGGVTAGLVLALGGFPSVGELTLAIGFLAFWLPTVSRRLQGPATAAVSLS